MFLQKLAVWVLSKTDEKRIYVVNILITIWQIYSIIFWFNLELILKRQQQQPGWHNNLNQTNDNDGSRDEKKMTLDFYTIFLSANDFLLSVFSEQNANNPVYVNSNIGSHL